MTDIEDRILRNQILLSMMLEELASTKGIHIYNSVSSLVRELVRQTQKFDLDSQEDEPNS